MRCFVFALLFVMTALLGAETAAAQSCPDAESCRARCGAGDGEACGQLGYLYSVGRGVPRDLQRGGELLEHACDSGSPFACRTLAAFELKGRLEKNAPREPARYEHACQSGDADACIRLGWTYEVGLIAKESPKLVRANALYARACSLGDARGCELQKTMLGRVLDRPGIPTCDTSTSVRKLNSPPRKLEEYCLEPVLPIKPPPRELNRVSSEQGTKRDFRTSVQPSA